MAKKLLSITLAIFLLLPSVALSPAYAADVLLGDIDQNGKIASDDARLALRGSVGLETLTADFMTRADVDHSGKVESSDARTILRASVKLDDIPQDACAHTVEKWTAVEAANGKSALYHIGECTLCGKPVFGDHDLEPEVIKESTCTEEGSCIEKCTLCGMTGDTFPIPAAHDWEVVADSEKPGSCTEPATHDLHCLICGAEKTEAYAPALGHDINKDPVVLSSQGLVCDRCGKTGISVFNDLVNVLKDGTHKYTGFKVETNTVEKMEFSGLLELMVTTMMTKKEREEMFNELGSSVPTYSSLVQNREITSDNFNLLGEDVVSKLEDGDMQAVKTELVKGVDFLAALPDSYIDEVSDTVDLAAIKKTKIGDVLKVTLTLPQETEESEQHAIYKIDSELGALSQESGSMLRELAKEFEIFGEDTTTMTVKTLSDITVTYYFDATTNAPIAATYDDDVNIDTFISFYLNDNGTIDEGAVDMDVKIDLDSFYFFDDYFKG